MSASSVVTSSHAHGGFGGGAPGPIGGGTVVCSSQLQGGLGGGVVKIGGGIVPEVKIIFRLSEGIKKQMSHLAKFHFEIYWVNSPGSVVGGTDGGVVIKGGGGVVT